MTNNFKRGTVAFLLSLSLIAVVSACGKKPAPPGERPGRRTERANPTWVAAKLPVAATRDDNQPMVGVWATDCAQENFTQNPQPHVTQHYDSYRYYLTVTANSMSVKFVRFVGFVCGSSGSVGPIELSPNDVWGYSIQSAGQVDGSDWSIKYTSFNGQARDFGDSAHVSREDEPFGNDAIRFTSEADDDLVYRRLQ